MSDARWGERRAAVRQRTRAVWVAGVTLALMASPFLLGLTARQYAVRGGAMRDGRFPIWIPIAYWTIVVAVALIGVAGLYRQSDEFERRRLIDGFAVSGMVLGLGVPPIFFVGHPFGIMYAWVVALLAGLAVFAWPRVAP
ncbi:hypothetical protein QLH51_17650 [Sphingomonas sp. 2R-10]|uniref:hypothetical protein n=1 Tax=Sphingomonas sp. 2R-10 TaxID=3045148 RepID=UPI000F7B0649|nr:hypothetical protein [Sphingomonas sp. 2R-10]MDJ0278620.1 hypothetical protein [Sphingomonas sp. 2R-10]